MAADKAWTHAALCELAVRWLQRSHSQGGHGCRIAFKEVRSGYSGETPDAIGFRPGPHFMDGTVVVECKVSRADFLADSKKPHRKNTAGLGRFRYYMAPLGLIDPAELPAGWGLLGVSPAGHVKRLAGACVVPEGPHYEQWGAVCQAFSHEADHSAEHFILVELLSRIGDPARLNERLREAEGRANRLQKELGVLSGEGWYLSGLSASRLSKLASGVAAEQLRREAIARASTRDAGLVTAGVDAEVEPAASKYDDGIGFL